MLPKLLEVLPSQFGLGPGYDIEACGRLISPEGSSQAPLDPVARRRGTERGAHRETEPGGLCRILCRSHPDGDAVPTSAPAARVDTAKVGAARERRAWTHLEEPDLSGQPRATLAPACLEDRSPGAGLHPGPETVLALPPARIGLKGSLGHAFSVTVSPCPSQTSQTWSRRSEALERGRRSIADAPCRKAGG